MTEVLTPIQPDYGNLPPELQQPGAPNDYWDQIAFDTAAAEQAGSYNGIPLNKVEAIGDTAVHHAETESPATLREELETVSPGLEARIEAAKEHSSFKQTPEVKRAIEGFYKDHYRLGKVMEKLIDGDMQPGDGPDAVNGLFETHLMRETAKDLLSQKSRGQTLNAVNGTIRKLFNEEALPAETVSESERAYQLSLISKLRAKGLQEGYITEKSNEAAGTYYTWNEQKLRQEGIDHPTTLTNEHDMSELVRYANPKAFLKDSRFAGQLEFHNTGHLYDITSKNYTLRSRTQQRRVEGEYKSQMSDQSGLPNRAFGMHSNLPHFSETYDPTSYKQKAYLSAEEFNRADEFTKPGTIAIPIAEIIKVAPYARDKEYAVVEPKDAVDLSEVTINDDTDNIGSQGSDYMGSYGRDRVFMSDYRADRAEDAVSYDLRAGGTSYQVFTETERYTVHGDAGFATGEGLPGLVILPYRSTWDNDSPRRRMNHDEQQRFDAQQKVQLASAIQELQATSRNRPEFAGKVVAPLRAGVIEFVAEAESRNDGGWHDKYKQTVVHSRP